MLFHSGLSPSASWRTVSTIRYMMFSSTLQKPGQLNPGDWEQSWKHCQHPRLREKLDQPRAHPEFMYLLHTSTETLGEKVSASPNRKKNLLSQILLLSHPPFVPFLVCRLNTTDTCGNSQLWDPFQCLCQSPKAPRKPWCLHSHSIPEIGAVSQGNGRFPHGTGTGCAVAVEGEWVRWNLGEFKLCHGHSTCQLQTLRQTLLHELPAPSTATGAGGAELPVCWQAV